MTRALESVFGDVQLDKVNYRIELRSYRVRDIVDFAPRAATPGGSIIHAELGLYQPYLKQGWQHGFGFMWEEDAMGYMSTTGDIDTRHPGIVMMMTQLVDDTESFAATGFGTGDSQTVEYTLAWGASLRKRTTAGTWSDEGGYGAVNAILETANYVHVAVNGSRIRKITKSTGVHSDAGLNASSTDYKWLITHGGYIYAGKDASSLIFRDSNEDLSALAGDAADDPDRIVIGGDLPTLGAIVAWKRLFVAREDGLFEIGEDNIARCVLDFSDQVSSTNFRSMKVHNNRLVFPIRDILFSWNGATLSRLTPPFLTDTYPYTTYGRFSHFSTNGDFLFMIARTNETTWEEHLICWDGVGWHKIAAPCTDGSDYVTGSGYDVTNNFLWLAVEAGATDVIYYLRFQAQSDFPYANFQTSGTHNVISSRMGMGFRWVKKSSPSIVIEAENCTAARYLVVYYNADNKGWYEWGGTDKGRITKNGIVTLSDPTGIDKSTLEYNFIQIRIDFVTDSATESPILEGFTLRFIMRPAVLFGHSFVVVAASQQKIGATKRDTKSVYTIFSKLEEARASAAPIKFIDPFGVPHQGYIATLERRAVERHADTRREGRPDIESQITVNFVEVG